MDEQIKALETVLQSLETEADLVRESGGNAAYLDVAIGGVRTAIANLQVHEAN